MSTEMSPSGDHRKPPQWRDNNIFERPYDILGLMSHGYRLFLLYEYSRTSTLHIGGGDGYPSLDGLIRKDIPVFHHATGPPCIYVYNWCAGKP